MLQAIMWTQWKSTRALVMVTTIIAFALPLGSLRFAMDTTDAGSFVSVMQTAGAGYSLLAALLGLLVALGAWRPDHAGRHVYALSLPIPRSRYALYRFTAGVAFLMPAFAGLLVGALLVAVSGAIPEGLHAYPVALTLRFALAAIVAYAIFFAIASSTNQTAGIIIGLLATVVFTQYLIAVFMDTGGVDILTPIVNFIFNRPGILSVFSGRWMLVDV